MKTETLIWIAAGIAAYYFVKKKQADNAVAVAAKVTAPKEAQIAQASKPALW